MALAALPTSASLYVDNMDYDDMQDDLDDDISHIRAQSKGAIHRIYRSLLTSVKSRN
jgi:hypothetical protein